MKKRILQICFGDGFAGSAKAAIVGSDYLSRMGFESSLLVSSNSLTEKRARERNMNIISCDSKSEYKKLIGEIYGIFQDLEPEIVVSHHSLERKIGIDLKRKFKDKFINVGYRHNMSQSAPIIGAILYNCYYNRLIACSDGVAKSLTRSGVFHKKVKRIYYGIEIPDNLNGLSGDSVKEKYGLKGKFAVGMSAWFHKKRKGFDILFDGFSRLLEEYVLFIIGVSEEDKPKAVEFAKGFGVNAERIIMPGYVENIWNYYKAMDVFILPSRSEGFPLSILEAAFAKTPIISSNIPGSIEFIKERETGYVFDLKKPQELTAKIIEVSSNKAEAERRSNNAYEEAMENYTAEKYAENLSEFYSSIAGWK